MAVTTRDKSISRGRKQVSRKSGSRPAPKTSCADKTFEGLCMNCVHAPDCIFASKATCPVVECEEFLCEGGCSQEQAAGKPRASAAPAKAAEIEGLCANCENRESCTFTRPQGGVWHCLEYR